MRCMSRLQGTRVQVVVGPNPCQMWSTRLVSPWVRRGGPKLRAPWMRSVGGGSTNLSKQGDSALFPCCCGAWHAVVPSCWASQDLTPWHAADRVRPCSKPRSAEAAFSFWFDLQWLETGEMETDSAHFLLLFPSSTSVPNFPNSLRVLGQFHPGPEPTYPGSPVMPLSPAFWTSKGCTSRSILDPLELHLHSGTASWITPGTEPDGAHFPSLFPGSVSSISWSDAQVRFRLPPIKLQVLEISEIFPHHGWEDAPAHHRAQTLQSLWFRTHWVDFTGRMFPIFHQQTQSVLETKGSTTHSSVLGSPPPCRATTPSLQEPPHSPRGQGQNFEVRTISPLQDHHTLLTGPPHPLYRTTSSIQDHYTISGVLYSTCSKGWSLLPAQNYHTLFTGPPRPHPPHRTTTPSSQDHHTLLGVMTTSVMQDHHHILSAVELSAGWSCDSEFLRSTDRRTSLLTKHPQTLADVQWRRLSFEWTWTTCWWSFWPAHSFYCTEWLRVSTPRTDCWVGAVLTCLFFILLNEQLNLFCGEHLYTKKIREQCTSSIPMFVSYLLNHVCQEKRMLFIPFVTAPNTKRWKSIVCSANSKLIEPE